MYTICMSLQPSLFGDEPAVPERLGRAVVGVRTAKGKVLNPGRGAASFADFTLNAYVGCGFGCSYCYAAAFVSDLEKRARWGEWVDVKDRALEEVARHPGLTDKSIFMSSATDPYQPLEAKVELTRGIVELLLDKQPYLIVQTRSPLVSRDIDLFQRFRKMRVNMSITTDDDDIRKAFEPNCPSIDRRFEALEECVRHGVPVGISVSPMLPIRDVVAFAQRIRALKPVSVYTSYFHAPGREFVASTREAAIEMLPRWAWNQARFEETAAKLREHLPQLKQW